MTTSHDTQTSRTTTDTERLIPTALVAWRLGITRDAVMKLMKRHPSFDALVVRRGCQGTGVAHLFNWGDVRIWAIKHGRWDLGTDRPIAHPRARRTS